MSTPEDSLHCQPIGHLYSHTPGTRSRFLTPRQASRQGPPEAVSRIELLPGRHLDAACHDLEGFSRIWVLAWFHLQHNWRPKVTPPRGPRRRRGVLATRSPHRPNPLALTSVTLFKVESHTLWIGAHDLVDGTPVLDIKPYLSEFDSHPQESSGWITPFPAPHRVECEPLAQTQLHWLALHFHPDIETRVRQILSEDPRPQRSRRVARLPDGRLRLGCGPWRVWFEVVDKTVILQRVTSRYAGQEVPEDQPLHLRFLEEFSKD